MYEYLRNIQYLRKPYSIGKYFYLLILNLGWLQAAKYKTQQLRYSLSNRTENYKLVTKHSQFPLFCRPNTSDRSVFEQIFIEREYSCLDYLSSVDLVVDCGANVGYSASYFLTRFPQCKIICIEPDQSNFTLLEQNLAPFKERVKLLRAGIWSHATSLKISEIPYRDNKEWAVQVRECKPDEIPEMQAIDIGTILKESGHSKISILKIDIEGAEAIIFSENYESWLSAVDNIIIELHDDTLFGNAPEIVFKTVSAYNSFDMSTSGELTIFKKTN
jgi:FkbM family methyltransferase